MAEQRSRRGAFGGNAGMGHHWIRDKKRAAIYKRDNHQCIWCGGPGECLDHILARTHGGKNTSDNLVTSCVRCNSSRGDKPAITFAFETFEDPYVVLDRLVAATLVTVERPRTKRRKPSTLIVSAVAPAW